jgi:hypothetical protein
MNYYHFPLWPIAITHEYKTATSANFNLKWVKIGIRGHEMQKGLNVGTKFAQLKIRGPKLHN